MKRRVIQTVFSLFLALICMHTRLQATADAKLFAKYPNNYFIETGAYTGDGVQVALDAGFLKVYSIELDPELFLKTRKRYLENEKVKIFAGDSSKKLKDVMRDIKEPVTFWLDAHFAGDGTAKGKVATPVLEELEQIRRHPVKTHTILIDDVRQFGTEDFEYVTIEQVKAKILKINPEYQFTFEDGYVPNDVLVAYIAKKQADSYYQKSSSSSLYDPNTQESDDVMYASEGPDDDEGVYMLESDDAMYASDDSDDDEGVYIPEAAKSDNEYKPESSVSDSVLMQESEASEKIPLQIRKDVHTKRIQYDTDTDSFGSSEMDDSLFVRSRDKEGRSFRD